MQYVINSIRAGAENETVQATEQSKWNAKEAENTSLPENMGADLVDGINGPPTSNSSQGLLRGGPAKC